MSPWTGAWPPAWPSSSRARSPAATRCWPAGRRHYPICECGRCAPGALPRHQRRPGARSRAPASSPAMGICFVNVALDGHVTTGLAVIKRNARLPAGARRRCRRPRRWPAGRRRYVILARNNYFWWYRSIGWAQFNATSNNLHVSLWVCCLYNP